MKILLFLFALSTTLSGKTQVVNAYAEVSGIATNVLTLGTVDEAAHTFEDNDWVILMQMQDNTIGDVTNSASFGDLGTINNAGVYEVRQILSHTETAGTPTTITLVSNPNFTFSTCANCQVQIISFREYGAPNYTTTANMSAKTWDGRTGGVLAMFIAGTLTLAHNLDADLDGFRGAGPNAGGSAGCQGNSNYRVTTQNNMADKGESIYSNTTAGYNAGMGKILNGGGGGNSHNGGGGGGGNYTSGGAGGPGWDNCSPGAGGLGGISLQANVAVGRVFMGGGGGAGEGNNNLATDGGNAGGIILIKADEITTTVCAGVTISANGENIAFAGNDGGGGGGAAGSIVFEVNTWTINGACPLTVEANGGNGGDVNNGGTHGGGGGGGQGVVFYSVAEPTTNVTTTTINGVGGCDNNSSPCNSQAGNGGGTDGDGIQELLTGPLPIEVISFDAEIENNTVQLSWITASERDNDFFTVERSYDAVLWHDILKVDGAGTSSIKRYYEEYDMNPGIGTIYYRLKQTDYNGSFTQTNIEAVYFDESSTIIYPNPAKDVLNVFKSSISEAQVEIYNSIGQRVSFDSENQDNLIKYNVSSAASGVYVIVISTNGEREYYRFSIEN